MKTSLNARWVTTPWAATAVAAASLLLAGSAAAHEGHGTPGSSHWHASDAWGFVMAGVALAAALWWRGRK